MRPAPGSGIRLRHLGTRTVLSACVWLGLSAPATAQGAWEAILTVDPYPSPYYSDWDLDPSIGTLTVFNHGAAPGDVRVAFSIIDRSNRVIASGTSETQRVPAGAAAIFESPYDVAGTTSHDAEIERIAERTGRLPEGDYTACAAATDYDGFVLAEACAPFTILYPDPPLLLAPADGARLDLQDELFQWSPVQVPAQFQPQYVLRIAEVLEGQTPAEALASNIPHHESLDLFAPNLRYPLEGQPFEVGTTYAWSVRAFDQNGYPLSANEGRSEIWTFRYDDGTGPTTPAGARTLTLANGPSTGTATAPPSEGDLSDICASWDDPPDVYRLPLDVPRVFAPGQTRMAAELYQDSVEMTWGLLAERSGRQYLLFGDCDRALRGGGIAGGLQWVATRKADRRQPLLDLLENVSLDPDPGGELALEYHVTILTLEPGVAAVPGAWRRPSELMDGREISIRPGLNVFGVLSLREHDMWSFFERLGYTEKEVEVQGFLGLAGKWSLGGSVGRSTPDSALDVEAEVTWERTLLGLTAALPEKAPLIAGSVFETVQWGLEIAVKDTWKAGTDSQESATTALEIAPFVRLTTHPTGGGPVEFEGRLVAEGQYKHQPLRAWLSRSSSDTTRFGSGGVEPPVLKLSSNARLDLGRTGLSVGDPEIEVKVNEGLLRGLSEGPSALDWEVKLSGALGGEAAPSFAKLTVEFGRKADQLGRIGGSPSRMDSIRADIARLETDLQDAEDRGATAQADSIARDLAIARNALAMWEAAGENPPADTASDSTRQRGPWHWKAQLALGNMSLASFLQLVLQRVRDRPLGGTP